MGPLTLLCKLWDPPSHFWESSSDQTDLKAPSTAGGVMYKSPGWWEGRVQPRLLSIFQEGFLTGRGWEPPSALARKQFPCLCLPHQNSTPSTGFSLEAFSSACLSLSLNDFGLHCLQELSPALMVRWGCKTLSTRGDKTPLRF